MKYLLVFLAVAVLDWAWAFYTRAVTERRALRAASLSVVLYLLASFATIQYVHDWRMLPFALAGAFVGTLFGVRK